MIIDLPKVTHLNSLWSLWKRSFGDTEDFIADFSRTAFSADRCMCAFEGGKVIASLFWFDCAYLGERVAYIYAVSTDQEYRGKGVGKKLMRHTHAHLKTLGYLGAILVPSTSSLFDFYEKLGYKTCSSVREFSCLPSENEAFIEEISAKEYAKQRRSLLPCGSVLQEDESIDFLSVQATLYKGRDFVLAARKKGDELFGIELLGNVDAAPDIVLSMGCRKGIFRTAGDGRPFAVYLPLRDQNHPAPSYFGLAFD